jgi:sugar lactone lactonase YvrE
VRPPIPVEEVARLPAPGTAVPTALAFSPDDRFLTFLHSPDRSLHRHLQAFDTATGERVAAVVQIGRAHV